MFGSIIHKDTFGRYRIAYPQVLEELALLLVTGFASKISVNNLDREKKGLLKAMDHFNLQEGTIVTVAQSGEEEIDGKMIRMVPFYRWAFE